MIFQDITKNCMWVFNSLKNKRFSKRIMTRVSSFSRFISNRQKHEVLYNFANQLVVYIKKTSGSIFILSPLSKIHTCILRKNHYVCSNPIS